MTFDFSKVTAIVPGSLSAVATSGHISLAESFINADHIVLVDVSGSMTERDSRDGQSRYDVACQELRKLQGELPGSIAIVAFASKPQFCPSGVPMMDTATGFGTDLAQGLRFIAPADGLVDVWVISDGEPNNEQEALTIARRMTSRINAVYVGPKGGDGADFLRQLCAIRGGKATEDTAAMNLAATVQKMIGMGQVAG